MADQFEIVGWGELELSGGRFHYELALNNHATGNGHSARGIVTMPDGTVRKVISGNADATIVSDEDLRTWGHRHAKSVAEK
jgi:hypothetical protein